MLNESHLFYIEPDNGEAHFPALKQLEQLQYAPARIPFSELPPLLSSEVVNYIIIEFNMALHSIPFLENTLPNPNICHTIVYNAPDRIVTSELIKLGHIKGYFCTHDSEPDLLSGVQSILEGDYSLSDKISCQLLSYYQSVVLRHTEPHFINLTKREIEVLQSLKAGMSNNRLADELYVSEHTVKSHLYKIFKKLGVRSRNQAIVWAHKFLP
ncbi:LuxR C-terminal-related transcriptional regulator [Vibrio sp. JC009]|uniref:LuxR C-terminal-related transcriptional regulator n=1 Tax=Vibrio sp. JC009 TaxID=2912314 RepID=UPI0023B1E68A|nr:LuxR C-terminal-related transcriptional regulator [Vibrio sp. JC009]WED21577.1 LuxR C-terminal-related transcriptional regulator [Vibrio sp. JC009]